MEKGELGQKRWGGAKEEGATDCEEEGFRNSWRGARKWEGGMRRY